MWKAPEHGPFHPAEVLHLHHEAPHLRSHLTPLLHRARTLHAFHDSLSSLCFNLLYFLDFRRHANNTTHGGDPRHVTTDVNA